MRAVLGIDAAWTEHGTSGIALLVEQANEWRCLTATAVTGWPATLSAIESIHNELSAVAADIPLVEANGVPAPADRRREADNAITRAFARHWCAAHTPNPQRPGSIGVRIQQHFGFPLATTANMPVPAILEVYPHAALVRLFQSARRLPYKVSRSRAAGYHLVAAEQSRILARLEQELGPLPVTPTTPPFSARDLKATEDAMDAIVCAWVGVQYLLGRAEAYGDSTGAVWVPKPIA